MVQSILLSHVILHYCSHLFNSIYGHIVNFRRYNVTIMMYLPMSILCFDILYRDTDRNMHLERILAFIICSVHNGLCSGWNDVVIECFLRPYWFCASIIIPIDIVWKKH